MKTMTTCRTLLMALVLIAGTACGETPESHEPGESDVAQASHGSHEPMSGRAGDGAAALGEVSFPTSCSAEVQDSFDRGVAYLHSFYFPSARDTFREVLQADPDCAMAHWGLAMVERGNPFAGRPGANREAAGLEAARSALEAGLATSREEGYVTAVLALYQDHGSVDFATRSLRYEEAMDDLRQAHPDDPEATIFLAREVTANASPSDTAFERQLRATELMEPLFEQFPNHPGLAHYIIHAYDVPALAERGIDAALAYAEIAPDAPHALHMPSHIFTRMGMWEESIETNRRSAAASAPESGERLHAWDYMVYGHLQRGEIAEADSVVAEANALIERAGLEGRLPYNAAAMEARVALEQDDWEAAASLVVRSPEGSPAEAVTRFARGVGAVRLGRQDEARAEVAELVRIRDGLRDAGDADWAERTDAQRMAIDAWLHHLEGDAEEARLLAEAAATLEERVEKHPVTPGPLLPARELQGDLLLDMGLTDEARVAYQRTLEREPNRARPEALLAGL